MSGNNWLHYINWLSLVPERTAKNKRQKSKYRAEQIAQYTKNYSSSQPDYSHSYFELYNCHSISHVIYQRMLFVIICSSEQSRLHIFNQAYGRWGGLGLSEFCGWIQETRAIGKYVMRPFEQYVPISQKFYSLRII